MVDKYIMASSVHRRTPSLTVQDSRGLAVREVAYWRKSAGDVAQSLITRQSYDLAGRLSGQSDPRLFADGHRPNLVTVRTLGGEPIRIDSVDAGRRLSLPGPANETQQRWDQRGNHWRYRHDPMLRVIAVAENQQDAVERYTYADSGADARHNLRGQLTGVLDPSGTIMFSQYGLLGQSLDEARRLAGETDAYITTRRFDPSGNAVLVTDAGGHRQESHYDIAGQLARVSLRLAGADGSEPVVRRRAYNAAGQLTEQLAGNGVLSTWFHDAADGRLIRQLAGKDQERPLQDLRYLYDPAGNVLRIEDHTQATVYFANQRVEPHRHFVYDSLYRLIETRGFEGDIPQQSPGLPQPVQPIDPGRRFGYAEHYRYDAGNNLVELQHVREGHSFTWQTVIDARSNRGVRQKAGQPDPVFTEHFDAHGNQLKLQPGALPLEWNSRDQLTRVTLLRHSNGLPDDEETYRYSQGERIHKCWLSHTPSVTHRREVHYLPGLQIHTRSDGQRLHVIELPGARCLHWLSGKPADIEADQLRYSLDDHLGSCSLELDRKAGVISLEHYYAFGGTAWWGAQSLLEASYKTVRHSGQEMDASGLYHYGARYYAPWLQRWVSADPAGDVDGLNLYAMVNNNPIRYIDVGGTGLEESQARQRIDEFSSVLNLTNSELKKLNYQLYNLTRKRDIYKTAAKKLAFSVATFAVAIKAGAAGAAGGAALGGLTGPAAPVVTPITAAVGGIVVADVVVKGMDQFGEKTGLGYSIMPDPATLSVKALQKKVAASPYSLQAIVGSFNPQTSQGLVKAGIETTARVIGKHLKIPYLKQALNIARQMSQLTEALNGSWGQGDLDQITLRLDELTTFLDREEARTLESFKTLAHASAENAQSKGTSGLSMTLVNEQTSIEENLKIARSAISHSRNLLSRVSQYLLEKQLAA
ncbi:RHS repeat domain-containing protein [Pseudomonas ekonensis]